MKPVLSICRKAIMLGPIPYLGLGVAIMALGAAMQMRAGAVVVGDGGTVFGLFARIGGTIGFIGLIMLALGISEDTESDTGEPDLPSRAMQSADITEVDPMDGATSRKSMALPDLSALKRVTQAIAKFRAMPLPQMRKKAEG